MNTEAVNDRMAGAYVPARCFPRLHETRTTTLPVLTCSLHGSLWIRAEGRCLTQAVLDYVADHRAEQYARWGANRDVQDGTGPDVEWVSFAHVPAHEIERTFRQEWDYDVDSAPEQRTWMRMLREEVAEAFAEDDPDRLREELVQVAALAVSWIEKISERKAGVTS